MKHVKFLSMGLLVVLSVACAKNDTEGPNDRNLVQAPSPNADQKIGDATMDLKVIGSETFKDKVKAGEIAPAATAAPTASSLLLEYPEGLIGEQNVIGGVITKI
jgi:hypothetical protein